jgi:flagellar biosynthetic protein FliQ
MIEPAVDLVRAALLEGLLIALPILAAGLLVGLLISLFQAVTQIQEQTLTFVPKIVVMILVAVAMLGWIVMRLGTFAANLFTFGPNPAL